MTQLLIYHLSIAGVDGVTSYYCESDDRATVLQFLRAHDHEGSSVTLVVQPAKEEEPHDTYDGEAAYLILDAERVLEQEGERT